MVKPKLTNIKSRYLEPKKPIVNANNLQVQTMSSSGSSTRTSSPAMGRKKGLSAAQKIVNESNISLDSLSSPAKTVRQMKSKNSANDLEVSIDSLAESMKSSSIKTSNTISHESLVYQDYFKQSNLAKVNEKNVAKTNGIVKNNVNVNNLNKTKTTMAATSSTANFVKKSFLSQRSKEILARKSSNSTNSSNKSNMSSPNVVTRDKSVTNIVKSGSTPAVTTGPKKVFNTTLHLRRTAKLEPPPKAKKEEPKPKKASNIPLNKSKVKMTNKSEDRSPEKRVVESKLERSSTFCKESSDNAIVLQIIE